MSHLNFLPQRITLLFKSILGIWMRMGTMAMCRGVAMCKAWPPKILKIYIIILMFSRFSHKRRVSPSPPPIFDLVQ